MDSASQSAPFSGSPSAYVRPLRIVRTSSMVMLALAGDGFSIPSSAK
jgi:hypothetical protein